MGLGQVSCRRTLVQAWSGPKLVLLVLVLLTAHALLALLTTSPMLLSSSTSSSVSLFDSRRYVGSRCRRDPAMAATWDDGDATDASCRAMAASGETAPIAHSEVAFKFPQGQDEGYSWLTWRVLAGLSLDVTFHGADVPTTQQQQLQEQETTTEKALDANETTPVFQIWHRSFPLTARLRLRSSGNGSDAWSDDFHVRLRRTLSCSLSRPMEDLVSASRMALTAQYICSLSPLLDLHFPKQNTTYILTVSFERSQQVRDDSELSTFLSNPSEVKASLAIVVGNEEYRKLLLCVKCALWPFIAAALFWFVSRLYLNDLYIAIPDRCLVAAAVALLIQDLPFELAVLLFPTVSPYFKLLEMASSAWLMCSLALFWAVFALDKLASNEPWERNTKYYWKQVLLIPLGSLLGLLYSVFSLMPGMSNPFLSSWARSGDEDVNPKAAVGLAFTVIAVALAYQAYFAILVYKLLCFSPSRQYPAVPQRTPGSRLVLLCCLCCSLCSSAWATLRVAADLAVNSNDQIEMEPAVDRNLAALAGALTVFMQGMWNLHVLSLLILLSRVRSPLAANGGSSGNVKSIVYNRRQQQTHVDNNNKEEDDLNTTEQLMRLSSSNNNDDESLQQQQQHLDYYDYAIQQHQFDSEEYDHFPHEYEVRGHHQAEGCEGMTPYPHTPRYYYYDDCLKEEDEEEDYYEHQETKHLTSSEEGVLDDDFDDDEHEVDGYESSLGPIVSPSISADSRIYYRTCSR